jgi:hypothetical protein
MWWSCCELIFWIHFIVAAFHVKDCSYKSSEVSFRNYSLYLISFEFSSIVKLFQQMFLLYLWLLQSYFRSLDYLEIFKHSTCILVWGINILWLTDIFSCVRLVNIWIIYVNFSIIACCTSFILNCSNWKTVFYVPLKCKLWTKVFRLNTNICNGNIFHSNLCNLSCSKCLWIQAFLSRIWGSHGGEYEDGCLLGCSTTTRCYSPEDSHLHKLFYLWYSLLIKWSNTFQWGNSGLTDWLRF